MKTLTVYDPPLCCPTGVCGPTVDPALVELAAVLARLGRRGIMVRRYNLGQQPMAFATNPEIKALLESGGVEALPAIMVDNQLVINGRYPTADERSAWLASVPDAPKDSSP
jgi:hypothetical protein